MPGIGVISLTSTGIADALQTFPSLWILLVACVVVVFTVIAYFRRQYNHYARHKQSICDSAKCMFCRKKARLNGAGRHSRKRDRYAQTMRRMDSRWRPL